MTSCLSGWATATGNAAVWAVLLVVALVAGVWGYRDLRKGPEITGVVGFVGGCAPFRVYAQNRWLPYGAAIRSGPSLANKQISARDPNQSIEVNGWVHGDVAYPHNAKPFNSNIWFHLADGAGWVSFAGVREDPTFNDPTLLASGGTPAPTEPGCQGDSL